MAVRESGKAADGGIRQPAPDVIIEPAWRRNDAALEAEAVAFWNRLSILPPDTVAEQRARELVAVARRGGEVIGLSTAALDYIPNLRARMAVLRVAVDPAHRRSHAGIALGRGTREILEQWAERNPQERVGGMLAVIDNRELGAVLLEPRWPLTGLTLIGFMPDGRQIRAAWFDHYRLAGPEG